MNVTPLLIPLLAGSLITGSVSAQAQPVLKNRSSPSFGFMENVGQITDPQGNSRSDIDFRISNEGVTLFGGKAALHYQWVKSAGVNLLEADSLPLFAVYRMDVHLIGANPEAQVIKEQRQDYYERYYRPASGEEGETAYLYQKITYKDVYPHIDWVLYVKEGKVEYDFVVHEGGNVADIKIAYEGAESLKLNNDGSFTATTPMGMVTEKKPWSYQMNGEKLASSFVLQKNILSFNCGAYEEGLVIDPVLSWATYYGGSNEENVYSGSVTGDLWGNGYLCGSTNSISNIATTGSFTDTLTAQYDAFLAKFGSAGNRLWATYYGSTSQDYGRAVATDPYGNGYLTGYTNGTGLSTTAAYQPVKSGGYDAFLVKFDSAGSRLWATYYGGSSTERGYAVVCDKTGNAYMTGYTNSTGGIATTGAYQAARAGGNDVFLVKFDPAGVRQWGTYYGGSGVDQAMAITCDTLSNILVAGYTLSSSGIASPNGHQTMQAGNEDGFLAKFDSSGNRLWATYYGGTDVDMCQGVSCDMQGNPSIVGYTLSTSGIATSGSYQPVFNTGTGADVFLVKFDTSGVRQWGTYYGNTGDDWGMGITSSASGAFYITGFTTSASGIADTGIIKDTLDLQDAFLAKFDNNGSKQWSTYLGGEDVDLGYAVYCNPANHIFTSGVTASLTQLSTANSFQPQKSGGNYDAYLALVNDCDLTAPTGISGPDTVCRQTAYTYTVAHIPGVVSYTWILPPGWTGAGTTDTLHLITGAGEDTLKLVANYPCGVSDTVRKPLYVLPLPVLTPSGNPSVCSGDSVALTASAGTAYQWLFSGAGINGATAPVYTAATQGSYSVVVTQAAYGCSDTSLPTVLTVHPLPQPVISASGNTLSTGSYSAYQWNHNGTPIVGAVSATYTLTVMNGLYTVTVTDSNGCAGTSAPYDADAAGVADAPGFASLVVHPNPAKDRIYIQSPFPVSAVLSAMDGRKLASYPQPEYIELGNYPAGVYLLKLYHEGVLVATRRVVVKGE